MKQIGIRWPDDLIARIDIQVKDLAPHGGSRSDFIRDAVEQMLERMESEEPRALAQPARADEPEPLVKSRVTVQPPKADIPPKVVPKIAGLVLASELPPTAICKCGHAANKHYQREGACVSCEKDEPCRSFRPV